MGYMMTIESEKDLKAKAARIAELERLIPEASRLMETAKALGVDTPDEYAARRRARARLMQERLWYERGHAYADWSTFLAEQEAREAKAHADARKRAKADADEQAKAQADAAARDAKARAEWEAEQDPWLQHKRAISTRTF